MDHVITYVLIYDKEKQIRQDFTLFQDSSDDECGIPKPPRDLPGRPKSAAVTRRLDFPRQNISMLEFSWTRTLRCWNFPGQVIVDLFGQDLAGILIVALQLQHGPAQRGGEAETADRPDFRPGGFLFFSSTRSCFCPSFVINQ